MSGHHHDEHHSTEQKPVSFTVPFYMALATLIILIAFLSLCDPKKGHHGGCGKEEQCSKECAAACEKNGEKKCEGHEHGAAMEEGESKEAAATADSTANMTPAAETKEEAHH